MKTQVSLEDKVALYKGLFLPKALTLPLGLQLANGSPASRQSWLLCLHCISVSFALNHGSDSCSTLQKAAPCCQGPKPSDLLPRLEIQRLEQLGFSQHGAASFYLLRPVPGPWLLALSASSRSSRPCRHQPNETALPELPGTRQQPFSSTSHLKQSLTAVAKCPIGRT